MRQRHTIAEKIRSLFLPTIIHPPGRKESPNEMKRPRTGMNVLEFGMKPEGLESNYLKQPRNWNENTELRLFM